LLSPKEHSAIVGRLKTAAGHLRAVIAMVETGEPADEVLHNLAQCRLRWLRLGALS